MLGGLVNYPRKLRGGIMVGITRLQPRCELRESCGLTVTCGLMACEHGFEALVVRAGEYLVSEHDQHEGSRKHLSTALSLLVDRATLYVCTDDQGKRLANQALTNGIEISEDEKATFRLA